MLIGRQIRGDEHLNIHESNQELWMNAEMVLVVTMAMACSKERRTLPEKGQRNVNQTWSTGQASWDIGLGNPVSFLPATYAVSLLFLPLEVSASTDRKEAMGKNAKALRHPPWAKLSCLSCTALSHLYLSMRMIIPHFPEQETEARGNQYCSMPES